MTSDEIQKVTSDVESKLADVLLWTICIAVITLIIVIFGAEIISMTTSNKMMLVGLTICVQLLSFYYIVKYLLNKHLSVLPATQEHKDVPMWTFNPEGKRTLTMGEQVRGALYCENQQEADSYMQDYLQYMQEHYAGRMTIIEMEESARHHIINYYQMNGTEYARNRINQFFSL